MNILCEDSQRKIYFDDKGQLLFEARRGGLCLHGSQNGMAFGEVTNIFIIKDVRKLKCPICRRGWETTVDSMTNQIQDPTTRKWMHETCHSGVTAYNDHQRFFRALCDAGVRFDGREVPNRYEGGMERPWYEFYLEDFSCRITLGRRKRVDEISLVSYSGELPFRELEARFAKEDVTKTFTPEGVFIHAWSDEKLREYVKAIAAALIDYWDQTSNQIQPTGGPI